VPENLGGPAADSFGKRIQELRRERGMTQRQVAGELGIDFTYLSKLENDRGEPPGEDLVRRLAQLFEVEAEELLAKAGKIPAELRERAQGDLQFATLLRTLPSLSPDQLKRVYKSAGVPGASGKPPKP
jgi:HTH-type transcriptional regulator, competence development regulator